MPAFDDSTVTRAPVEAVWKVLYDPARIPQWWEGVESVQPGESRDDVLFFSPGYPVDPALQRVRPEPGRRRVLVSCQVSDLVFDWALEPLEIGGTRIAVHVEIPEAEAQRVDRQRAVVAASLRRLARVASAEG
jgi:hypothetical protein